MPKILGILGGLVQDTKHLRVVYLDLVGRKVHLDNGRWMCQYPFHVDSGRVIINALQVEIVYGEHEPYSLIPIRPPQTDEEAPQRPSSFDMYLRGSDD